MTGNFSYCQIKIAPCTGINHITMFWSLTDRIYDGGPIILGGRDNVVSIATRHGLEGTEIKFQWWHDFLHLSRPALGAHPASCTMGTGSFPGVKAAGA